MSLYVLNLYEDSALTIGYSKSGDWTYPIWQFPPWDFDAKLGQVREREVFLYNEGLTTIKTISGAATFKVYPYDTTENGYETMVKLALTELGLDGAIAGGELILPTLDSGESSSFWVRATVSADSTPEDITWVVLRVEGTSVIEE